ncbi:MAG: hypothetical protein ACO3JL_14285, partial [Myxococcota bacterium]
PRRIDPRDDDGWWKKLEAGAVTGDATHLSASLLAELGITRAEAQSLLDTAMTAQTYFIGTGATADRVRRIVQAHLDNMFRCGHSTACLSGKPEGVPFIIGDECYSAQGCFDFDLGTDCPQDGLISITASFRGEESFTDLNGNGLLDYDDLDGNGRHNPGEPIRESGNGVDVPFNDVVLDMPEAFLDKDDNCAPDDHTGSLRMTTYNAIRRSDLFSDEDGSGSFGYTVQDPATGTTLAEPQLTNHQWDRDKQVFFTDHLFVIQGAPKLEAGIRCDGVGTFEECPFNNENYLCREDGAGDGVLLGCYPRASDPAPLTEGQVVEVRFRWSDANGNCYSPGFDHYAWAYEDSNYYYLYNDLDLIRSFTSERLSAGYCGFGSAPIPRREWCNAYPYLGAGYLSAYLTSECFGFESGTTRFRRMALALTDTDEFALDAEVVAKRVLDYRISCPAAP